MPTQDEPRSASTSKGGDVGEVIQLVKDYARQETLGPLEVVRKVLTGTGDCGTVDWTLLGLSMPVWSLIGFVLLAAWGLYAAFRRRKGRNRL